MGERQAQFSSTLNGWLGRATSSLTSPPKIFGGRTAPTIADGLGAGSLAQAARLELQSVRRHGGEMFFVYRVLNRGR